MRSWGRGDSSVDILSYNIGKYVVENALGEHGESHDTDGEAGTTLKGSDNIRSYTVSFGVTYRGRSA